MPRADRRDFCPISEINWDRIFNDHRPGWNEPTTEIDRLVEQYQEPYPDKDRRAWIERRLRAWWQGRTG